MNIYLYGPSGSGKTTVGRKLAGLLGLDFIDVDQAIESKRGLCVNDIFQNEGEAAFRGYENRCISEIAIGKDSVVSLGGGALLNEETRLVAERSGVIFCLIASPDVIINRIRHEEGVRPLLNGDVAEKLTRMLNERSTHYASFPQWINTDQLTPDEVCWKIQTRVGRFFIKGMGSSYTVTVADGCLDGIGKWMKENGLRGPVVIVTDENVQPLYNRSVIQSIQAAGYAVGECVLPAGEHTKTIDSALIVWKSFLENKLERGSTAVALGGGVIGDLTGYAASAYLRGIRWVNVPTSLLAMVDSSLGGKTGVNLPEGKNLVGAFHSPAGVWVDPDVLHTLLQEELRNGMGEVIKHGVIGDPELFEMCSNGWGSIYSNIEEIIRKAIAVKVKVILEDPYEKGLRQVLNFGHTVGHAVESASDYALRHGEAVAIGMVSETRLSENINLAPRGLTDQIVSVLEKLELPVQIPQTLPKNVILNTLKQDKKRKDSKVLFALPVSVGEVKYGIQVDDVESIFS